jgi:hypothetical protein
MTEERLQQINLFDEKDDVFLQDFKDGTKVCTYCKKELPVKAFPLWSTTAFGGQMRRSACRECQSKHAKIIERLYKSAPPRPNKCECCGIKVENITNKKKYSNSGVLQLDHEHTTEKFRGWVCYACNQGIGKLGDNLKGVIKAVLYLSNNNTDLILKTIKNI